MVSSDTVRTVVGILGNAIALGLLLSPVPNFVTICKKKSVEQFSAAPYLSTLLNCMLWVVYGLPWVHPHSVLVLTINGSGLVIQLTYVLLFLTYSEGRKRLRVAHTHQRRTLVVGSFCVIFGALMYAAPLSIMSYIGKSVRESDIYSLGVIILELITRRKAKDVTTYKDKRLVKMGIYSIESKLDPKFPDRNLNGNFSSEQMQILANLVMSCVKFAPEKQPSISMVVNILSQLRI